MVLIIRTLSILKQEEAVFMNIRSISVCSKLIAHAMV